MGYLEASSIHCESRIGRSRFKRTGPITEPKKAKQRAKCPSKSQAALAPCNPSLGQAAPASLRPMVNLDSKDVL